MRILDREPAMIFGIVAALVQLLSITVTHWTAEEQGAINAVIVAAAGALTAWRVSQDAGLAALAGFAKAAIALALAFGLHIPPNLQTVIMMAVSLGGAVLVRDRVSARIPAF